MERPRLRFPRPVYESLPWLYVIAGLAAFATSYTMQGKPVLSFFAALTGFVGVIGGVVILLRRKDYREMRTRYPHDAE